MEFVYSTGGREKYFKDPNVGDCVTRAICNATGKDYKEVYDDLKRIENTLKVGKHERKGSVRDGTRKRVFKYYLEKELGWIYHATMDKGTGIQVHLTKEELPPGTLIVGISKHLTCVKDGVIYDTYNCSSKSYFDWEGNLIINNNRAVYNYWTAPTKEDLEEREYVNQILEKQKASIEATKSKIQTIKDKYKPSLDKLNKKLKEIQHQIVIETNRMNKEIAKVKKEDGDAFCNSLLGEQK